MRAGHRDLDACRDTSMPYAAGFEDTYEDERLVRRSMKMIGRPYSWSLFASTNHGIIMRMKVSRLFRTHHQCGVLKNCCTLI